MTSKHLKRAPVFTSRQTNCWFCYHAMTVWTWPGHKLWSRKLPDGSYPIPDGLVLRRTGTVEEPYWCNVCPHCGKPYGDFFLYCEPDGAFFDLERD